MVAVHRSQELLSVFLGDQDWGALQKPVNQNTAHQDQLSLDLCKNKKAFINMNNTFKYQSCEYFNIN